MKARISVCTLLAALSIAACATDSPADARQMTLVGELHVKGSEPFPTVMLETNDKTWELNGMTIAEARTLDGKRVTARGTIERPPAPGTWLPSLRVEGAPEPVSR